jgi:hypothetical protein
MSLSNPPSLFLVIGYFNMIHSLRQQGTLRFFVAGFRPMGENQQQ